MISLFLNSFYTYYFKILCVVAFVFSFELNAQVNYPTDSSFISTLTQYQKNNFNPFLYQKIDTSITNMQNYFPRNTNGNLGLSSSPLENTYQSKVLGFTLYQAPYENDLINKQDIQYFQTKGPYANLTGIAGSKQEQTFKLLFSNTFKNKLNISLGFNRYSGFGFYKKQQSFTNNFYTTSNYTSKNGRVGYYGYFLFNKVKHQENGGIKNDSLFVNDVRVNKLLLPLNLSNAKREVRYSNANINPWFRLNKVEDSSTVFSHFVDYEANYLGAYTKYDDTGLQADTFYHVFYIDTVATHDSTHWRTLSNALHYSIIYNPLKLKLQLGFKNEYNKVHQYSDSTFMSNFVNGGLYLHHKKYNGYVRAEAIVSGINANDVSVEFVNNYDIPVENGGNSKFSNQIIKIKLSINYENRHPDYIYNTWFSNHYAWNNTFVPTQKFQTKFNIIIPKFNFDIGVLYQTTKNLLYFNEQAVPEQSSALIKNVSAYIKKELVLFKHLGFNLNYQYQSSSYQAIVSLPNHVVNSALYFKGQYKKAMQFQIGFNVTYYNKFNAMAYMPATNMYYVQTQKETGNYPFVDFFLNVRIKPVRFFVKIDHLNQGFTGNQYSLTPGYLQNDRVFKFGLNWLFFD